MRTSLVSVYRRWFCGCCILAWLCMLPVQAQVLDYSYITNNGAISITAYSGPGGAVLIPSRVDGLPVTAIGSNAFYASASLNSVTIPETVTNIGAFAFSDCYQLREIFFRGDAPSIGAWAFAGAHNPSAHYLPGTIGWGASPFWDTSSWLLPEPVILAFGPSFGVQSNAFGFRISWATNASVVVEACADLFSPVWTPLGTNTLIDGWSYFSDPEWVNYPARFYRVRLP